MNRGAKMVAVGNVERQKAFTGMVAAAGFSLKRKKIEANLSDLMTPKKHKARERLDVETSIFDGVGGDDTSSLFPPEIWTFVVMNLDAFDLDTLSKVNRFFYHFVLNYIERYDVIVNVLGKVVPSRVQREIMQAVLDGYNVLITGEAGSGKTQTSKMIRLIFDTLNHRYAVCAATALAANAIEGRTFHSLMSVSGDSTVRRRNAGIPFGSPENFNAVETVLIDEVSMLGATLFDRASQKCKRFGRSYVEKSLPFAGKQVITIGDFLQLTPIMSTYDATGKSVTKNDRFAFESDAWQELYHPQASSLRSETPDVKHAVRPAKMFFMKTNFRRKKTDQRFAELLNDVRFGRLTEKTKQLLNERAFSQADINAMCESGRIQPVKIFATNRQVEAENDRQSDRLPGTEEVFREFVTGDASLFERNSNVQPVLKLKVGTRVVVNKNHHSTSDNSVFLYNGKTGTVVEFVQSDVYRDVEGFATLPLVRFDDGTSVVVRPTKWEVTRLDPETDVEVVVALKIQLPLLRAWALTIHKSQGMTLEQIVTDLRNVWDDGQAYVALSRGTSLEGIYLLSDQTGNLGDISDRIKASARAIQFYEELDVPQPSLVTTVVTPSKSKKKEPNDDTKTSSVRSSRIQNLQLPTTNTASPNSQISSLRQITLTSMLSSASGNH